jgi:predicted MFS family arabinose efflux permease
MGFYQGGVLMPVAIGPVIGGVLAGSLGWKSVFWFLTIYGAACYILIILVLPETLRSLVGNGSGKAKGISNSLLASYQRKRYVHSKELPDRQGDRGTRKAIDYWGPVKILLHWTTFSAIVLVAIHYAAWQMVLTALSTLVRQKYHTTETQIGLIFLANGVGSIIGTLLVGKLLDHDYKRYLQKFDNDEHRVPIARARLRTAWVWSGLECASVLTFGWTVDQHVHISVPIICLFVLGWAAISIQSAVSTYLVDIHHSQSASATASLNLVRCLLGAGGTAVIGPMIDRLHAGWAFTLLAAIMLVLGGAVLLQMLYGSDLRRRIKKNFSRSEQPVLGDSATLETAESSTASAYPMSTRDTTLGDPNASNNAGAHT